MPFALVAVVLLVGSAVLVASTHGRSAGGADPDTDAAMDRTVSATRTALIVATAQAARAAARDPVTRPANTTYGRVLRENHTFRDYLELRTYLAARRALKDAEQRVGDVTTTAALPPVSDADDARRAIDRVTVARNGDGLVVTVRNVTLTASRQGRRVVHERRTLRVGVASPVLAVHDSVQRFERRLRRGPLAGSGLGRRLSARLHALVWARGYAQYGGAPIANVLANRHVALVTNGAVLDEQAAVFGRAAPASRRAYRRAATSVGLSDLLAAGDLPTNWTDHVLDGPNPDDQTTTDAADEGPLPELDRPSNDTVRVDVGQIADDTFLELVHGEAVWERPLGDALRRRYAASARLATAVSEPPLDLSRPDPPGEDWVLQRTATSVDRSVRPGDGPAPAVSDRWHRHRTVTRHVAEEWTMTAHWEHVRRDTRRKTRTSARRVVRVGVSVVDAHGPTDLISGSIVGAHRPGGPLDGDNLAGTPAVATRRLVTDRGGFDAVARQAAAGNLSRSVRVAADPPENLTQWVYEDVARLRDRVRNVSVQVPQSELASGASATRSLVDRFETRRSALLDRPARYRSLADRLRVAARAVYVRAVHRRLQDRMAAARSARERLNESVSARTGFSLDEAGTLARQATIDDDPTPDESGSRTATVATTPSYLTLDTIEGERVPATPTSGRFRPLVARNLNVFSVPYGTAADAVFGDSSDETRYRTAAATLRQAARVDGAADEAVAGRGDLRTAVRRRTAAVTDRAVQTVVRETQLDRRAARRAVREGLGRWPTTAGRALAVANGSAATAVADAVARHDAVSDRVADELALRLRRTLRASRTGEDSTLRVPQRLVNETTTAARRVARAELERTADRASETTAERLGASTVFAGLPVLPSATPWYATLNVWHVTVRGEYARFTVRTHSGGPSGSLTYSRDGAPVRIDVDGDGTLERLGTAERLSFTQETVVLVAVPPGQFGVGDRDGVADERSSGWPTVGVVNDSEATDGNSSETRQSKDDPPARLGHVPRAAGDRAGLRRRPPPGVRR